MEKDLVRIGGNDDEGEEEGEEGGASGDPALGDEALASEARDGGVSEEESDDGGLEEEEECAGERE